MFVRAGERIGAPRKDAMRLDAIEGVEENLNFGQHFTGSIIATFDHPSDSIWQPMSTTSGSRSVIGPLCILPCVTQIGT